MSYKAIPSRVLFVDGLPGTGKTSLSQWLEQRIRSDDLSVRFISEYDKAHPLHWFQYYDGGTYIPPEFTFIPLEDHMQNSIEKWTRFSNSVNEIDELLIIDGYPFLNSVGVFLWGDADEHFIGDYINQMHEILARIKPLVIYLHTDNLISALNRKLNLLQRDELYDQFLVTMNNLPFLQNRGISGTEGVLVLWKKLNQMLNQYYLAAQDWYLVIDRDNKDEAAVRLLTEIFIGLS